MAKILFSKDIKNRIKVWSIEKKDNSIIITFGLLNMNTISTIVDYTNIDNEIASRIAKKRKEGYKSLSDLNYNNNEDLTTFLIAALPKYSTDANLNLRPMKCQRFKEGVVKYPAYAQPKYNGLRAVLRWETWVEGEGMFAENKEGAKLRTKEGLEYVMPHITNILSKKMFQSEIGELVFDGELYIHGKPLNYIKSSCPMTNSRGTVSNPSGNPLEVVFVIFDLAISDIPQDARLAELSSYDSTSTLWIAPHIIISIDSAAMEYRDLCIKQGYEGCVIRETDAEYAFGFRPRFIRKFKDHIDSEFLIVGVTPKPSDNSLPMLVLKNDINDATFESVLMGNYEYQREVMEHINEYIGKFATVRYRERTGTVDKLPFHTNVLERPFVNDIRNKKDE